MFSVVLFTFFLRIAFLFLNRVSGSPLVPNPFPEPLIPLRVRRRFNMLSPLSAFSPLYLPYLLLLLFSVSSAEQMPSNDAFEDLTSSRASFLIAK